MKTRVLLSLAASFFALVSLVPIRAAATTSPALQSQARASQLPSQAFGVPFPRTHEAKAWQQWRAQVLAHVQSLRNARLRRNSASPASSTGSSLIETVAGAAPYQSPATALQVGLGDGAGAVQDANGNLFVATGIFGVVLKIDSSSNVSIYAGQALPTGPATQSGDGGPATQARLVTPYALALDTAGNLYISDFSTETVRVVNASTGIIQTVAGIPNQAGYSGDGGPATAAELSFPSAMALDGNGDLFIADSNHIREVNLASGVIQTVAGSSDYQNACVPSATSTCPALSLDFYAYRANSLAVYGTTLYIAPQAMFGPNSNSLNAPLVSVDLSTGATKLVVGAGLPVSSPVSEVSGVAVDAHGTVYFPSGVSIYSLSHNTLTHIAGTGEGGFSGDGGPANSATLIGPQSISISPTGSVVTRDGNRVRSFTPGGLINTLAGDGTSNLSGDGGPGTHAGLGLPFDVASDSRGNVYTVDLDNYVVRRLDAATGVITTIAGDGAIVGASPDGALATQTPIYPFSIALDQSGHVYIADLLNDALRVVDPASGVISTLIPNVSIQSGMAFDGNKTLYANIDGVIQAIDVTTGSMTLVAGNPNSPYGQPSGDGGPATRANLGLIQGIAVDGNGNLYLSDFQDNLVRVVNLSTGIIQTLAGQAAGSGDYSGDGGPATAANLYGPVGITYDGAGHLDIAESAGNDIRQVDLTSGVISTFAGSVSAGFSGDGGAAGDALLFAARAITTDPNGNLFIADTNNARVRRVLIHPTKLSATLTSSASSANPGDSLTLTATYNGLSFGMMPTGSVSFLSGTTPLGTASLTADGSGNYVATLTTAAAPSGTTSITALYSGDAHYASESSSVAVIVGTPATPSYTLSANPATLSIKQGASGSVTFSVTPKNGFNQAVSFSCDSTTLPAGVSCTFTPASVTPSGAAAITSTLTVQTTAASASSSTRHVAERQLTVQPRWWIPGGSALALLVFGVSRSRRRVWQSWLCLALLSLCVGGATGCGAIEKAIDGDNGSSANANATPVGNYSIKVTTSTGTGAAAVTQPTTVSLTVTQ